MNKQHIDTTPTGRVTAVRARCMSDAELRAALALRPPLATGSRKIVAAELKRR